jgi:hypothetical protein
LFLKDSTMNNYVLENVTEFSSSLTDKQTLLVIHKLHRTPYHIGILYGDTYYALTIRGAEIRSRAEVTAILGDKAINNLMIEIKHTRDMVDAGAYFTRSALDHKDFLSCLFPVKNLIAELTTNNKFNDANNLFDLLDLLKEHNLAGKIMATRMTPIMESKIVLMRYDTEAIKAHIKKLQEKNNSENNKEYTS